MTQTLPFSARLAPVGRNLYIALIAFAVSGCGSLSARKEFRGELPVVIGPVPRAYETPLVNAYKCYAGALAQVNAVPISVAVGDVKDYTGKYSINEGNAITQGASLMVYSALGKLGKQVAIHERVDTRIGEMELAYTDRRQLGDGQSYALKAGEEGVPWLPYFGGTIMRSRYYIVGGITEANWDIGSGGAQAVVSGVGGKGRIYAMNIGVDLRIVDTKSLLVLKTVSISKQIVGEEVGIDIFRFFGSELFDIHAGSKRQEPLQLGVRTAIEQGVLELLGEVSGVDPSGCIPAPDRIVRDDVPERDGAVLPAVAVPGAKPVTVKQDKDDPKSDGGYLPDDAPERDVAVLPVVAPAGAKPVAKKPAKDDPEADGGYRPRAPAKAPSSASPDAPIAVVPDVAPPSPVNPVTVVIDGRAPLQNASQAGGRNGFQVRFEFDSAALQSETQTTFESVAQAVRQGGSIEIQLVARDTELLAPARRLELAKQRAAAVEKMLVSKDLGGARVSVTWLPDPSDSSIVRDGVGFQVVGQITVSR